MDNEVKALILDLASLVTDLAGETAAGLLEHSTHMLRGRAVAEARGKAARLRDKQNAIRELLEKVQPKVSVRS